MKIIKSTPRPNGKTRLIVELEPDEDIHAVKESNEFLTIRPNDHYRLGEPLHDDVMAGHILAGARRVHWCSVEQKWREA